MKKDGPLNHDRTFFFFTCYGWIKHVWYGDARLILKKGQVNRPREDVCQSTLARVAHNVNNPSFETASVLYSFAEKHNMDYKYKSSHGIWGFINETTGLWNGAVGMVSWVCL